MMTSPLQTSFFNYRAFSLLLLFHFSFLPGTQKGIKNGTATGCQLTLERRGKKICVEMALLVPSDHHSSLSKATLPCSLLSPLKSRQGQGQQPAAGMRQKRLLPAAAGPAADRGHVLLDRDLLGDALGATGAGACLLPRYPPTRP